MHTYRIIPKYLDSLLLFCTYPYIKTTQFYMLMYLNCWPNPDQTQSSASPNLGFTLFPDTYLSKNTVSLVKVLHRCLFLFTLHFSVCSADSLVFPYILVNAGR